jgi:glycyl-tRNA synthetase
MLDKVRRLEVLTPIVADMLGLTDDEKIASVRAAALSKADLATSMVVEMTSLQGIIGGQYARLSGESESVAKAIAEQYLVVSRTRPGLALALADRIDSLVGLFAAGLAPKGSNDPFALRRAAIQIVENLIENEVEFDLREAVIAALPALPVPASEETSGEVLEFINNRLETYLLEGGIRTSVVRAVLAEQGTDPFSASKAAATLNKIVKEETWPSLLDSYSRCVRIVRDQPLYELRPDVLELEEELQLLAAYEQAVISLDGSVASFVSALADMEPAISQFFDNVLVMDDDVQVRQNRLALLQKITGLAQGIADLSYLEGF